MMTWVLLAALGAPPAAVETPADWVGKEAPRFILRTLNPDAAGPRYLLRDHVGPDARTPKKQVLLDFAASWCVPCRTELAALAQRAPALEKMGVGVVVVVIDNEKEGIETMRKMVVDELKLPFPVASDRFQVLARRYRVSTLPLSVVVDADGRVRHVQEGFTPEDFARLEAVLGLASSGGGLTVDRTPTR